MAIEWLFDSAPVAQLGWEADLGWVRRAGEEPMRWVGVTLTGWWRCT